MRVKFLLMWFLVLFLIFGSLACVEPMSEGRGAPSEGFSTPNQRDFGEEVYKFLLREARSHPTGSAQRVQATEALKQDIVSSINLMIPSKMLPKLEAYMRKLLPFYDDQTLPKITRGSSEFMADVVSSELFLKALILSARRIGLVPRPETSEGNLLDRVLGFPKQKQLLLSMTKWWLSVDGVQDDGVTIAADEKPLLKDFFKEAASYLRETTTVPNDSRAFLLSDFLLVENSKLELNVGRRCAVRFDLFGKPIKTPEGIQLARNGALPVPFGIPNTASFGSCGEAISSSKKPLYDTRKLNRTILGSILFDTRKLIKNELDKKKKVIFPLNMARGVRPLMGQLTATGGYSSRSPLLQAQHASFAIMKGPQFHKLIRVFAALSEKEQKQMAALLALMEQLGDISKANPSDVRNEKALLEEVLPYLQEMGAKSGFIPDLLKALSDQNLIAQMKKGMIPLLRYRAKVMTVSDYKSFKQGNSKIIFDKLVDHKKSDTNGNISYLMAVLGLLDDVNRRGYKSRLKAAGGTAIPFIEMRIKNLALLYMRAIIGDLSIWETIYVNGKPIQDGTVKDLLKNSLPALGFSSDRPNPEELGMFINRKMEFKDVPLVAAVKLTITLEPIYGRSGHELRFFLGPSLMAGLASGLITKEGGSLAPIAKVFHKYKMLPRLLDLVGVLHRHWASSVNDLKMKNGHSFYPVRRSNLRSMEPMLLETMKQTDALERLSKMGGTLVNLKIKSGNKEEKATAIIDRYLAFVFGKPKTAFKQTPLGPLADALEEIVKALEGPSNKLARKGWEDGMNAMIDMFMKIKGRGDQARFQNARIPVILTQTLYFFADEIERRDKAGQWGPDLANLERKIKRLMVHPVISKALDLVAHLLEQDELLRLTNELLLHLLPDPIKEKQRFRELLGLGAILLAPSPSEISVPTAHFLGETLDKHPPLLTKLMAFLNRTIPLDNEDILIKLLRNGVAIHPKRKEYLFEIFPTLFRDMHRIQPGSKEPLIVDDLKSIFMVIARYLLDKEHGMEKLYKVIQGRNGSIKQQPK